MPARRRTRFDPTRVAGQHGLWRTDLAGFCRAPSTAKLQLHFLGQGNEMSLYRAAVRGAFASSEQYVTDATISSALHRGKGSRVPCYRTKSFAPAGLRTGAASPARDPA